MNFSIDEKLIEDFLKYLKAKREKVLFSTPWLSIAISEVGTEEIAGKESNSRIDEYLETVNLESDDEIPWCSAFLNWVMKQAGIKGTKSGMAKSWLGWGISCDIKPGAIAIFHRGRDPSKGHVGLILDENKDYIYLLGGNQRNRVGVIMYRKKSLAGIRWPGGE